MTHTNREVLILLR